MPPLYLRHCVESWQLNVLCVRLFSYPLILNTRIIIICDLHFNTFNLDAPSICCFIQCVLHCAGDSVSITEYLMQGPCSQCVPQSGLSKQSSGVMGILHIGNRDGGIRYSVINHRIHRHCHTVFGEYLNRTFLLSIKKLTVQKIIPAIK